MYTVLSTNPPWVIKLMWGNSKGEGEEIPQRYQQRLQLTQVHKITQRGHWTALGNDTAI